MQELNVQVWFAVPIFLALNYLGLAVFSLLFFPLFPFFLCFCWTLLGNLINVCQNHQSPHHLQNLLRAVTKMRQTSAGKERQDFVIWLEAQDSGQNYKQAREEVKLTHPVLYKNSVWRVMEGPSLKPSSSSSWEHPLKLMCCTKFSSYSSFLFPSHFSSSLFPKLHVAQWDGCTPSQASKLHFCWFLTTFCSQEVFELR